MKKSGASLFSFLLATFLLVSCTAKSLPTARQQHMSESFSVRAPQSPSTAPISLKIDTGLSSRSQGKILDFSRIGPNGGFSTQALPNGAVVFQESFTKPTADLLEVTRLFRISDPSKRYSFHLVKHEAEGREGRAQVNLNGSWIIQEKDFESHSLEVLREGFLLNATNSLLLRLRGKPGTRFTITVVEAGEAGVILRRRGWEKTSELSQADRLYNNDTNIFYPDDPNSLAGLEPYEGDEMLDDGTSTHIGESLANGTRARIVVGSLTVVMKEPIEANLQALQARFPITVLEQHDSFGSRFVTLALKFDEVSLSYLPDHFQALNQRPGSPALTEAVFSSVNTAKTIAAAAELEAKALDLIYGVSLHNLGEKLGAAIETQEEAVSMATSKTMSQNGATLTTPPAVPAKASDLWWLDAIKAREAWNYSMGENATIAVIDSGFASLRTGNNIIPNEPDFKSRVLLSSPSQESYLRNCVSNSGRENDADCNKLFNDESLESNGSQLKNPPGHGLWVTSLMGSGDNDGDGITGVAPRAQILPMFHRGGVEKPITHQLKRLYDENVHVDVVNISLGRNINLYDIYFANATFFNEVRQKEGMSELGLTLGGTRGEAYYTPLIIELYRVIYKLTNERKVVFVVAAGNNNLGWDPSLGDTSKQTLSIPAAMNYVIPVGAYQLDGSQPKRAEFNIYPNDDHLPNGETKSNYGPHISIWAPGKGLWVQGYDYADSSYQPRWHVVEGTSHAAPLVAGTVALMKSIDKNLTWSEAYTALKQSGKPLSDPSFQEAISAPVNAIGLNTLEAVKRVSGATEARSYCLQYTFFGEPGSSTKGFSDVNDDVPGSGPVLPNLKGKPLNITLPDIQIGDYLQVLGWSQTERSAMVNNELTAIQAKKMTSGNCRRAEFIISSVPPTNAPADVQIWLNQGSQRVPVTSNQVLGIGIDAPNMDQIRIEIDGREMPLREVAQNYVLFEVLSNLEPGVKDVVIRYGSQQLTLAQALEYQSAGGCDPNEEWSMRIYNVDDTAKATVNLNEFTYGFQSDSGFIPINSYLSRGQNEIRFSLFNTVGGYSWGFILKKNNEVIYQSEEGQVGVIGANNNDQSRPNQTVFNKLLTIQANVCRAIGPAGLSGTSFNNTSLTPPAYSTKVFNQVNFVEGDKYGDQFGIGLTDNFTLRLEGELSLPPGYPAGAYTLILAHDDGARLSLNNQTLIDAWGPYDYSEHSTQVQLDQDQDYPIRVDYLEMGGEAELGLFWIKPDGTRELVPAGALSH